MHLRKKNAATGRSGRVLPRLEALEDRTLPSVFTPTTFADGAGPGTLRNAVLQANANGQDNTILLAAGTYSLTPAAGSRNVAMLERNLGVRLFQRTTRKLTLTEAGERFLLAMQDHMEGLQAAIADAATDRGEPAGVLVR